MIDMGNDGDIAKVHDAKSKERGPERPAFLSPRYIGPGVAAQWLRRARLCADLDIRRQLPHRLRRPSRLEHDSETVAAGSELRQHVVPVLAAETDDAVAVAGSVLHFRRQRAPDSRENLDPDVGVGAFEPFEIGLARQGGDDIGLETA